MTTDSRTASRPSTPSMQDWLAWIPSPRDIFMAPQNLAQSILPGWVIGSVTNITEQNSSAPDTEAGILATHSYGRQLGRIMDALAVVVAELPKHTQAKKEIQTFAELRQEIDEIKARTTEKRLERIASDLAALKRNSPGDYDRIVKKLSRALKDG